MKSLSQRLFKDKPYLKHIITIFNILLKNDKYSTKYKKGQKPVTDLENVLLAILYRVISGCTWKYIPTECFGNFSYSTCYLYFRRWVDNGLWKEIWIKSLITYSQKHHINWRIQCIDSTKIKNVNGIETIGSNSTDRGRNGTKLHTICDRNSITLGAIITGANTHDSTVISQLLESMVIKPPKHRKRNHILLADMGYFRS